MSALRAQDLDGAHLVAQLELAAAAAELVQARALRRRVRLVAASALLPAEACACGRALALPGFDVCDLCLMEEARDPEVLAEPEPAAAAAAPRALAPRPHGRPRRLLVAAAGK